MWQPLAIVVFLAVLVGAFFPRARVRAVAQFFGGAVFVLSALAAVAMVVGAVVLESRGGGVLILGAILLLGAMNESAFALARGESGVTIEGCVHAMERLLRGGRANGT